MYPTSIALHIVLARLSFKQGDVRDVSWCCIMEYVRRETCVADSRCTGPRLLQGEGCLLTLTTTILLYILIKPNEMADIWPVLSYKNVCFLSSILYCSLWLYRKTKLNSACRPQPFRHTQLQMAGVPHPSDLVLLLGARRTFPSLMSTAPSHQGWSLLSGYLICLG